MQPFIGPFVYSKDDKNVKYSVSYKISMFGFINKIA